MDVLDIMRGIAKAGPDAGPAGARAGAYIMGLHCGRGA